MTEGEPVRVVVKLGGSLLTDRDLLHRMVAQLSAIQGAGHQVIVIHGGGKQIKETLEQLGIPSRFHQGLRITDAPTMRVVQMVLCGWVNKEIVASFHQLGRKAVGLCGGDGDSFVARKFQSPDEPFDYGYVGEVFHGDPKLVDLLLAESYLPVIACIAIGIDGAYYNINADEMAAAAAIFCHADRLVFLTDVPGVLDGQRDVIAQLSRETMAELRRSGIISEGMLPKTRACERALAAGIQAIHIVGGKETDCLPRILLKDESLGTRIV